MSEKPRIETRYRAPENSAGQLLESLYGLGWQHMLADLQPITSFYLTAEENGVHYWKRNIRTRFRDTPPQELTNIVGTNMMLEMKHEGQKLSRPCLLDTSLTIMDTELLANITCELGQGDIGFRVALASMRDYMLPSYCFDETGEKINDYPRITIDSGYQAIVYDTSGVALRTLPFGWLKIEVKCLLDEIAPCMQVFEILDQISGVKISTDDIKEQIEQMVNGTGLIQIQEV